MTCHSSSDGAPWYKDAVIYEVLIRSFFDSNGDGIGDLRGLIDKLDYVQSLGVTCLWLLPFFPSPRGDDGYDVADYCAVDPSYGTLAEFKELVDAAHARSLHVIIELVLNHTSDQHPWFQRARHAPPATPERDFYVWSETDQKYRDARIAFVDTEVSNWAWDEVAKSYYWHRFFHHQPDLNYKNPAVVQQLLSVVDFWLEMGVDGFRLDAVPYLVEREGTSCENLPETHAVIKAIRSHIDTRWPNRILLAEANQQPPEVCAYFGDADECHMAYHFPVMPRMFMALHLEERDPIVRAMENMPAIPDSCQWALFLRNHDELTLEMVSEAERDSMYLAFGSHPGARLNRGIRRRLAPLMNNSRQQIQLLMSVLLSFPGTPIIYYGDEIGMGDNLELEDRNGVRTAMQWNADRNAGFSHAEPALLSSPVITDPVFGYQAVNVDLAERDPSSLLNWTANTIRVRRRFKVFGRGGVEFLSPANHTILAYLRRYQTDVVLCVANLSPGEQSVELDLGALDGSVPVDMLGSTEFPRIGGAPYLLTIEPYGFYWFELRGRLV